MTRRDLVDLLLLGAIWGASFLFMRLGAAEFGPVALAFVRVAGAAALLVPLMLLRRQGAAWRTHGGAIAGVGVVNSALPFVLYAVAALALTTALMSVFNATVSIWAALIAWLWLKERLDPLRWLGLAIGVAGVLGLSWGKADFRPGAKAWAAALALSLLCTGLAYILYFRLLARTSAAAATSVTFLIPPFALLWGYLALGEVPTGAMLAGCAVILLGTALATGLLRRPGR
jgi:drug/metabolite transporter (DMT)-like permease